MRKIEKHHCHSCICLFFNLLIVVQLFSQKLELEWNGSKEELIQLIEGGKLRFAIEG